MNWTQIAFGITDVLSIVLVLRLVALRLHDVYRIFSAFLIFQVLAQSLALIERFSQLNSIVDYRWTWLVLRLIFWVLSVWIVYALLRAILARLPGILRFSRHLLNGMLALSVVIALITAGPEYVALRVTNESSSIAYMVSVGIILERLVSTVALLTLLLTLVFILWFPVTMPRNLALFSVLLSVYFTAKTVLLLLDSFWLHGHIPLVNNGVTFVLSACLVCWILFLNKKGEVVPVTLGHSWHPSRRTELLDSLESLNSSLVRAASRRPTSTLR